MRIALITREYPPETSWGGIGTFYVTFARALKEAGCDVEVFTQALSHPSREDHEGILVHRVVPRRFLVGSRVGGDLAGNRNVGTFALCLAAEMLRAFSARHREMPFDLVEGHEHLGINAFINMRHGRTVATVTRYHTAYHTLVSRRLVTWPDSRLVCHLERRSLLSAGYRICASRFIDEITAEDFPGVPRADAVIPFEAGPIPDPAALSRTGREPVILFAGRLVPELKNPDMVARAFASLADRFPAWRVEFAGLDLPVGPNETMWQKCERILSPYPGRFTYHGGLPREEMNALYGRARILVVPSTFESFGLVAQEAMACGCVPLVADGTALPEVVGNAGIVFRRGNQDDLVAKLAALMSDEARLEELSRRCVPVQSKVPPRSDGTVGVQGQVMTVACRDCRYVGQIWRHINWPLMVI